VIPLQGSKLHPQNIVEQVPTVAAKHGQQTLRFAETIRIVGYALGGDAACRLEKRRGMPLK
jgi:hypothetical protein